MRRCWQRKRGDNVKTILSAEEAAKVIGCAPQKVRERMKHKLWDLGRAIPPEKTGKSSWTYEIMQYKLERFLGMEGEN